IYVDPKKYIEINLMYFKILANIDLFF
ncbi:uncharacterized protein METZ01_LOCUS80251, partial [marine metagenome]